MGLGSARQPILPEDPVSSSLSEKQCAALTTALILNGNYKTLKFSIFIREANNTHTDSSWHHYPNSEP